MHRCVADELSSMLVEILSIILPAILLFGISRNGMLQKASFHVGCMVGATWVFLDITSDGEF